MKPSGSHSNTETEQKRNTSGLKPFVKDDKRINRKGRPKSFDKFRALALGIADEKVKDACKKLGINSPNPESENLKVAAFILRKWAFSKEPKLQIAFTEVAFGKVPMTLVSDENEEFLIGKIIFEIVNAKTQNA